MKGLKLIRHGLLVAAALFLLVVLPVVTHVDLPFGKKTTDADTGASIPLPDQPSGSFFVLINTDLHKDSLADWRGFFRDEEFAVIFEDVSCLVARGDTGGLQMARRFQAQLPENQMKVREENPTLLASKAEAGAVDIAIFSKEMADHLKLKTKADLPGVAVIEVSGGEE